MLNPYIVVTDLDGRPATKLPISAATEKAVSAALSLWHNNEDILLTSMVDPDGADFGGYYLDGNLHGRYHIVLS